jgi:signal transduction histidine kinase
MVADSSATGWWRRLDIPVRDPRFWIIQALVLAIDVAHTLLEDEDLLVSTSELYLLSVSVFLIPVVYAGLTFGLRGAVPTTLWALVLSFPEISHHEANVRVGILIQFAIVLAIAIIVGMRVDREKGAIRALEQANRQLSRLNATASAVAGSLDLDQVLHDTLSAEIDPRKQQVAWIRLAGDNVLPARTTIHSSGGSPPTDLVVTHQVLTSTVCQTGNLQSAIGPDGRLSTVVAPLKSGGRTVGAIGLSQATDAITAEDLQVFGAVASQLSVALDNIRNHESNRAALISLRAAKENLETYIELATEAQEEERKRLSRELHDDILQSLVVAKAQIEPAEGIGQPDLVRHRLTSAQHVLEDAIVNLRRYCRALRPSLLDDLGLIDAVDWLVGDLRNRTGLDVQFGTAGTPHRLSSRDELLIFRVIQEALHNVEKHAHASQARIRLSYDEHAVGASISDNGCGIAKSGRRGLVEQSGLGLRGMEERTKLLGGTLAIDSLEGKGTVLTLNVPLGASEVRPD